MSYDIWLEGEQAGGLEWNYTSNVAPMWRKAGADLATFDGELAGNCITPLVLAISELRLHAEDYRAMEPSNGWGSLDGLISALEDLVTGFQRAPMATVRVDR